MNNNVIAFLAAGTILILSGCQTAQTKDKEAKRPHDKEEVKFSNEDVEEIVLTKSYIDAWLGAVDTIKRMGLITSADQNKGLIEANIQSAKVKIAMNRDKGNMVTVNLKVQRDGGEQKDLAKEIATRLKE